MQIGIWGRIALEVGDGQRLSALRCRTDLDEHDGRLAVSGAVAGQRAARVRIELADDANTLRAEEVSIDAFEQGLASQGSPV